MKLLGSITSPYVRRIRLYLALMQVTDYQFVNLDIFSQQDRQLLTDNNPVQKVPVLITHLDGKEQSVYDSRVIYRFLALQHQQAALTWQQENLLTLIDAANDSLVSILLLTRSEFNPNDDKLFFNLQRERVDSVMQVLASAVSDGDFEHWQYPSICLFCLLDWVEFRDLYDFSQIESLKLFYRQVLQGINATDIAATDPRGV